MKSSILRLGGHFTIPLGRSPCGTHTLDTVGRVCPPPPDGLLQATIAHITTPAAAIRIFGTGADYQRAQRTDPPSRRSSFVAAGAGSPPTGSSLEPPRSAPGPGGRPRGAPRR